MSDTSVPAIPQKPSCLCLTDDEIADFELMISKGQLPANWLDLCDDARELAVFGEGFKTDREGRPQEQGRGSPLNQVRQSVDAYRKWGVNEPDYERNLARMEKELVASDARRAAEGPRKARPGRR
jgi:hypothetical protein